MREELISVITKTIQWFTNWRSDWKKSESFYYLKTDSVNSFMTEIIHWLKHWIRDKWFIYWFKNWLAECKWSENTDSLKERGVNLVHGQKDSLTQNLTLWMREERIAVITELIHWFKHWLRDPKRSESFTDFKNEKERYESQSLWKKKQL